MTEPKPMSEEYPRIAWVWTKVTGLESDNTKDASWGQVIRMLPLLPLMGGLFLFDVAKHWRD